MQIIRQYEHRPPGLRGAVYALGNFDGVHLGHRQVIGRAADIAAEMGVPLGVLVFEPHPQQFFFPDRPFFRLTPFRAKARLLERIGVDVLAALPFDSHMSKKLAPEFVLDVLVNGLHAVHVVAGYDFRFGKGRGGDAAALSYMGEMEGFGVSVVEEVKEGGVTYSSTRIRELLANGDPRGAAKLLGHWWTVETHVQGGDRRGRTIGFPTANVDMGDYLRPAYGIYAVRGLLPDGRILDGAANLGIRPMFDPPKLLLEPHFFDFAENLYDQRIAVQLIAYLHAERAYDGLDALMNGIAQDCVDARQILAGQNLAGTPHLA